MIKFSVGSFSRILRRFFKQMNAPYRLSVTNEDTLSETLVIHLTKKSLYILFSTFVVLMFFLLSLLFLFTPLRYYIPGNNQQVSRKKLIELQRLADSVKNINKIREAYIINLLKVSNGEVGQVSDSSRLSEQQIRSAQQQNLSRIDHASRYEYLKNVKPDSSTLVLLKKDSLKKAKISKEKN